MNELDETLIQESLEESSQIIITEEYFVNNNSGGGGSGNSQFSNSEDMKKYAKIISELTNSKDLEEFEKESLKEGSVIYKSENSNKVAVKKQREKLF